MLTIGQLAAHAGIGVESVRFYERRGLIDQPRKPVRGYRRYPVETVQRVLFIRRAAAIGFTLREIAELLALRARPTSSCGRVRARAMAKVADIDRRLDELQRMRAVLVRLAETCRGDDASITECSILDAFAGTDAPLVVDEKPARSPRGARSASSVGHPRGARLAHPLNHEA